MESIKNFSKFEGNEISNLKSIKGGDGNCPVHWDVYDNNGVHIGCCLTLAAAVRLAHTNVTGGGQWVKNEGCL